MSSLFTVSFPVGGEMKRVPQIAETKYEAVERVYSKNLHLNMFREDYTATKKRV